MYLQKVERQDLVSDRQGYYSWGLFASGFEKRSPYIASSIKQDTLRARVALGFHNELTTLSRLENDRIFSQDLNIPVILPPDGDYDAFILNELDKLLAAGGSESVRILVDYSVMTRAWYGLILNWARFAKHSQPIEIDFAYAYGKYLGEFDPLSISDVVALAGFEGISSGVRSTLAIFGLGFDKYATLAVYDRLEPDTLFCCVAVQEDDDVSAEKALKENEVVCEAAAGIIRLPLGDVGVAFSILAEYVHSQDEGNHIVIVPMGPKPHVLASLLLAIRMPRVTCLHAQGIRANPLQIDAKGPACVARVTFVPD